jgi:hypothetical protein
MILWNGISPEDGKDDSQSKYPKLWLQKTALAYQLVISIISFL